MAIPYKNKFNFLSLSLSIFSPPAAPVCRFFHSPQTALDFWLTFMADLSKTKQSRRNSSKDKRADAESVGAYHNPGPALLLLRSLLLFFTASGQVSGYYPRVTILNTNTNNAIVSQRPTTVIYCAKPFPVSAMASAPAAPAFP